jgi:hypothetical protein
MKNVPEPENELEIKGSNSSKFLDETFLERFGESMEASLPDYPALSPEGTFHNSCGFSGTEIFGRDIYTASSEGFSGGVSSSVKRIFVNNFDTSGQDKHFESQDFSTDDSFLCTLDNFLRNSLSKNSRFALGFPIIVAGAELYQISKIPGMAAVVTGILMLGLGQYYRECPEGLDG